MYGTGSAHYTRAYIETGHKESFLPFFPSLVHSSILHLPSFHLSYSPISISMHATILSLTPILFSTLYLIPIFPLFLHLLRSSIVALPSLAFPRSFILVSLSIVSTVLYTVSVPCLAFSFHLLTSPPIANHVRSRSLPHFSSVRSRSLVNPKQQVPTLLAALRVHLLNRFLSLVLLAGRSIGHVARFGRGFHFQKNPDRTIPLESWVKHRTRLHLSTWFPIIDSNQPFPTTRPSILSRINK